MLKLRQGTGASELQVTECFDEYIIKQLYVLVAKYQLYHDLLRL